MSRLPLRPVIGFALLVVLLVAADRVSALLVARSVAQGLQAAQGLARPPDVTFHGTPFLTQVVGGRYRQVDVTITDLPTAGPLVVDRLDATLLGVRAPAVPSLRGDLRELSVDRGEATAFASFASLQRAADTALADSGVRITLGRAGDDQVAFTARVSSFIGTVTLRGQARVTVQRGVVAVRLLPETLTGVPAELRSAVASQVELSRLVPALPFGFKATGVVVDSSGLRLRAVGTGLIIPV